MNNKKLKGNLILLITAFIWGMAFAFQKEGMEHIGPLCFASSRLFFSSGLLIAFVSLRDRRARQKGTHPEQTMSAEDYARFRSNTRRMGMLCGVFLAFGNSMQQTGLLTTDAGKAGFITALYVIMVPIIGLIFFRKRPGLLQWIAVAIGLLGMYLLCMNGGFSLQSGDLLLVGGALGFAMQILVCDKYVGGADPVRGSMIQFVTAFVIVTALSFMFEEPSLSAVWAAIVPILYCGVLSGGVGYTFQMLGQTMAEPVEASLIMCLESVFSVLGGWLLLGERLTPRELAGCAVMFLAIVISQIPMPAKRAEGYTD